MGHHDWDPRAAELGCIPRGPVERLQGLPRQRTEGHLGRRLIPEALPSRFVSDEFLDACTGVSGKEKSMPMNPRRTVPEGRKHPVHGGRLLVDLACSSKGLNGHYLQYLSVLDFFFIRG